LQDIGSMLNRYTVVNAAPTISTIPKYIPTSFTVRPSIIEVKQKIN